MGRPVTTALDLLVRLLQEQAEVFGARLIGAGFVGPCVALVRESISTASPP